MAITFILSIEPVFKGYTELKQVEKELPFTSALLTLYGVAGLPPSSAIGKLAAFSDIFPASGRMSKRIEKLRQLYALDEWTAVKKEAEIMGSEAIQDFIFSIIGTVRSGVDLYIMLRDKMKSSFMILRESYVRLSETMKTMADVILVLFGVLPMILFTLYSMFATRESLLQIRAYSYIVIPLLTVAILLIIDALYPKTPVSFMRLYRRIVYYIPPAIVAGVATYFAVQFLSGTVEYLSMYNITLSLFLASLPVSVIEGTLFYRRIRRLNRIDNALPSFLRDMTEEVKRGVSPLLAISSIVKIKTYGSEFDELLNKIEKAVTSGSSFEDAIRAVKDDLSWTGLVIFSLLSEAIKFGGKGEVFEEVTNITREITDTNKIMKQNISPLKMFSFMTMMMLILIIGILVRMIVIPLSGWGSELMRAQAERASVIMFRFQVVSKEDLPSFIDIVFSGLMVNAVCLGLLTGKISDNKIGVGLIYVVLYLVISILSMFMIMFGVSLK
ncbi:type II secretion system F family protein [Candidatus Bathyarchaeota archaeon]|nr:type II secretion system F family protein [Candidatus Bathyarchaeota archaeon]